MFEKLFFDLRLTVIFGISLAFILVVFFFYSGEPDLWLFLQWLFRWVHVLSGIMWLGLLYYFNFVQIPNLPLIPNDQKPAITKFIAPAALWWFRWSASSTIFSGLILAHLNGYLIEAFLLRENFWGIGLGMWMGTLMWFNVWFVIWPYQQKALGIKETNPEDKINASKNALLVSRFNTVLSFPMLVAMTVQQNPFI